MIESRKATVAVIALLDRHLGALAAFQSRLIHYLDHSVDALQRTRDALHAQERTTEGLRQSVDALERTTEDMRQSVSLATASTQALKREVERLRRPPAPPAEDTDAGQAAHPRPVPAETDLDAHQYVCFEDVFRGAPEEIAARQRTYLPYFHGASKCWTSAAAAASSWPCCATRASPPAASIPTRRRSSAAAHGGSKPPGPTRSPICAACPTNRSGSVLGPGRRALEADYLMQLLGAAQRTLRPGSRVALETINAASWTAFFSAYVRDITHRHPLHPDTLGYLLRASGFVDVTIVYRAPIPDAAKLQRAAVDPALAATPAGAAVCALAQTVNQHADRLNGLAFAEQDYAAIAKRP